MKYDADVWGPHYWFFIHTIGFAYPNKPNETLKKKYHSFIQDLPLFIPDSQISSDFADMLDKYPVKSYLDSRDSFIKWINYIHNQINEKLGKPHVSLYEAIQNYYELYKPREEIEREEASLMRRRIMIGLIVGLFLIIVFMLMRENTI
jgi:hypothetical protein